MRFDDRDFRVDDRLVQLEYEPITKTYTGRSVSAKISYKLDGGQFGIDDGYYVLGLDQMTHHNREEMVDDDR